MLFNKRAYSKADDQKVLHKVGKHWAVLSTALLLALAGTGVVASQTTANADTVNSTNNGGRAQSTSVASNGVSSSTASKAASLEAAPSYASSDSSVAPSSKASSATASSSAKAPSLASASYLNGNNGSAASYHAKANFDSANQAYYKPVVNSYVNSLNSKFPKQVQSLSANYTSAQSKQANDQSLAKSYSAVNAQFGHAQAVSSLAQKANVTTSAYIDSVAYNTRNYNSAVSNGSANVIAGSKVNSYAQLIDRIQTNSVTSAQYRNSYELASADYKVANAELNNANARLTNATDVSLDNNNRLNSAKNAYTEGAEEERIANIYSATDASTVNSYASRNGLGNSSAVSSAVSSIANGFRANVRNSAFALPLANGATSAYRYSAGDNAYQLLSDTSAMNSFGNVQASYANVISEAAQATKSDASAVANAQQDVTNAKANVDKTRSAYNVLNILGNHPTLANIFGNNYSRDDASFNRVLNDNAGRTAAENATADKTAYMNIVKDAQRNPKNAKVDAAKAQVLIKDINQSAKQSSDTNKGDFQDAEKAITDDAAQHPENRRADEAKLQSLTKNTVSKTSASAIKGANADEFYQNNEMYEGLMNPYEAGASDYSNLITNSNGSNTSAVANSIASMYNSASASYASVSNASAAYAKTTGATEVLASSYASSYANDSSADSANVAHAKDALAKFYNGYATKGLSNAYNAYQSAVAAEPNDATLAHAYGINVLNHSPKFITTTRKANLHNNTIYSSKNAIESVPVGTQLAVNGIGFDNVGTIRYAVNYNGKSGYITANPYFVVNTYAEPGRTYRVTFKKDSLAHSTVNFESDVDNVVGKETADASVIGKAVRADNNYRGVTRIQLSNGNFVSSNYGLVALSAVGDNSTTSNSNNTNNNQGLVTFSD